MIQSTLHLYASAISETVGAVLRGPFVWLMLIFMPIAIMALAMLVSPLGFIGGFVVGFAAVYLYGAYLYAVGQSIEHGKPLGIAIIRESLGEHVWDVMHVAFLHWIVSLVFGLGGLPSMIPALFSVVVFILFNPWPEVIHSERTNGAMDILVQSFRFMSSNGPEWVFPHLLLLGLGVGLSMIPGGPSPELGLGAGVLLHPVMVFRGVLYRKLSSGNRRIRAWQSRF